MSSTAKDENSILGSSKRISATAHAQIETSRRVFLPSVHSLVIVFTIFRVLSSSSVILTMRLRGREVVCIDVRVRYYNISIPWKIVLDKRKNLFNILYSV